MILKPARRRTPGSDPAPGDVSGLAGDRRSRAGSRTGTPARRVALGLLAMAAAVVAGASAYALTRSLPPAGREPSGIPASIPASLANLMNLDPLPRGAAPRFALTDQAGHAVALPGLRGKVVVLEFLDDHCTDICPIVAQEFVDAYHDLGAAAGKVTFAAVNVNPYHTSVPDVLAFSREQQLTSIPRWHFLTGPLPALRATWNAYHIAVAAPDPGGDIIHTSAIYFIDPHGMLRFLASPEDESQTGPRSAYHTRNETGYVPAGQMADWGHGIALLASYLARQPG